jgi:hypothetical protein
MGITQLFAVLTDRRLFSADQIILKDGIVASLASHLK